VTTKDINWNEFIRSYPNIWDKYFRASGYMSTPQGGIISPHGKQYTHVAPDLIASFDELLQSAMRREEQALAMDDDVEEEKYNFTPKVVQFKQRELLLPLTQIIEDLASNADDLAQLENIDNVSALIRVRSKLYIVINKTKAFRQLLRDMKNLVKKKRRNPNT